MKVHFSETEFGKFRLAKVKAVAALTKTDLTEVVFDAKSPVAKSAHSHALPLLETPQGTIFSSNAIIRFLANSSKSLYGSNPHEQALVDQWLDIINCDLEPTVGAVLMAVGGREVDCKKIHDDLNKFLGFVDGHLKDKKFLVGNSLSIADIALAANVCALCCHALGAEERKNRSNLITWWNGVCSQVKGSLGECKLTEKCHASLVHKPAVCEAKPEAKTEKKEGKKGGKKEEKKEEKPKEEEEEFDVFGADDGAAAPAPKPKPVVAEKKKEKKEVIAKSIVVFDVKVYEQETDLKVLANKIFTEVAMDGLVWNKDYKILPVAFGMNMLEVGCVIEDLKVTTDDIFEKIESWEEVQSTDTVAFQKV